jgi:hypothetical protein
VGGKCHRHCWGGRAAGGVRARWCQAPALAAGVTWHCSRRGLLGGGRARQACGWAAGLRAAHVQQAHAVDAQVQAAAQALLDDDAVEDHLRRQPGHLQLHVQRRRLHLGQLRGRGPEAGLSGRRAGLRASRQARRARQIVGVCRRMHAGRQPEPCAVQVSGGVRGGGVAALRPLHLDGRSAGRDAPDMRNGTSVLGDCDQYTVPIAAVRPGPAHIHNGDSDAVSEYTVLEGPEGHTQVRSMLQASWSEWLLPTFSLAWQAGVFCPRVQVPGRPNTQVHPGPTPPSNPEEQAEALAAQIAAKVHAAETSHLCQGPNCSKCINRDHVRLESGIVNESRKYCPPPLRCPLSTRWH